MKILSLAIDGYKMFNPSPKIKLGKDINLLIGVNGSGKSTVLEAIAIIFSEFSRYCEKGETWSKKFSFSIEYSFTLSETYFETTTKQRFATSINHVVLSHSKDSFDDYIMKVDGGLVKSRKEMTKFLPDNLIFYYAGFCNTLDNIIAEIYNDWAGKFYNIRNPEKQSNIIAMMTKSLIYIKPEYFPLLFILNYIDAKENRIVLSGKPFTVDEIKFHLTKPEFTSSENYREIYNVKGFLGNYLTKLLQDSQDIQPLESTDKKSSDAILNIGYHRSLLDSLENLLDSSNSESFNYQKYYLFHVICLLFHIGLLKKILVTIRDSEGHYFDINQLSEGEQQLITVDAINNILCKGNSLLFFDEPDAFLHPQRQREILPFLKDKFSHRFTDDYVQILTTSHSLFSTQSISVDNVLLFKKNGGIKTFKEKILSYVTISEELFGIGSEFDKEIEMGLSKFKSQVREILLHKRQVDNEFQRLVKHLRGYGEAIEVIINFEIRKLLKEGILYEENG